LQEANIIVVESTKKRQEITKFVSERETPIFVVKNHKIDNSSPRFQDRNGILILGVLQDTTIYNEGNAFWNFLVHVYPLILAQTVGAEIPLFIAGRGIPNHLRELVSEMGYHPYVRFHESPEEIQQLFKKCRVLVAANQLAGGGVPPEVRI
jgi:hypothetical protein